MRSTFDIRRSMFHVRLGRALSSRAQPRACPERGAAKSNGDLAVRRPWPCVPAGRLPVAPSARAGFAEPPSPVCRGAPEGAAAVRPDAGISRPSRAPRNRKQRSWAVSLPTGWHPWLLARAPGGAEAAVRCPAPWSLTVPDTSLAVRSARRPHEPIPRPGQPAGPHRPVPFPDPAPFLASSRLRVRRRDLSPWSLYVPLAFHISDLRCSRRSRRALR